jgi:hypothetical protein
MKNKRLIENAAELAREQYVKCINLATADDFANPRLTNIHAAALAKYIKWQNKPLKRLRLFTYFGGRIHNDEMLDNPDICFTLNFLCELIHKRAYTPQKLKQLIASRTPSQWYMLGMNPSKLEEIEKYLLEGVDVTNS